MTSPVDLRTLTVGDFEPRREEVFVLQAANGTLPLKLHAVQRLEPSNREGGAFSLLFVAPAGPFLPQSIYPLVHETMGTIEMFLVPLGPRHGGNSYEAIFT